MMNSNCFAIFLSGIIAMSVQISIYKRISLESSLNLIIRPPWPLCYILVGLSETQELHYDCIALPWQQDQFTIFLMLQNKNKTNG